MNRPRRTRSTDALLVLILAARTVLADIPADETTDFSARPQRLAEAYQALAADDLEAAAAAFREVLAASPAEERALLGLSRVHEQRGELLEALELARQAAGQEPQSATAVLATARLLARLGASARALEALTALRDLDPEETQGYVLAALLLRDLGRRDEAIEILQKALSRGLQAPELHEEIAFLSLAAGQPAEAQQIAQSALAQHPDRAKLHLALGLALAADPTSRGQALPQLERALELGTALNEAQELATSNQLGEAMARLEGLLIDHPDEGRAHTLRAKILYSLERPEEALAAVRRSRELDPGRLEPHFLEGMFLMGMNRPAQAMAPLRRALALDPGLGPAHFLLGGAAAKLGRPLDAVTHFERAWSSAPTARLCDWATPRPWRASAGSKRASARSRPTKTSP